MPNTSDEQRGIIKMHLRERTQLFDSLDHSPFREKDLDRNAEEYIIESAKELSNKLPWALHIYLDQPAATPDESATIEGAIHVHFGRRAVASQRAFRQLMRRGSISLTIGLAFLITFFLIGQSIQNILGDGQITFLIRESFLIGGWVAMWKPLEIFLYDWWPLEGEKRLFQRLSRIPVTFNFVK